MDVRNGVRAPLRPPLRQHRWLGVVETAARQSNDTSGQLGVVVPPALLPVLLLPSFLLAFFRLAEKRRKLAQKKDPKILPKNYQVELESSSYQ